MPGLSSRRSESSCRHPDRRVEAGPALCFDLPRWSGADFMLGLGASSDETRSAARERRPLLMKSREMTRSSVICDAAYHGIQTRVSVFPWAMPTPSLVPRSLSIWAARSR
jgi:hypothetical protein